MKLDAKQIEILRKAGVVVSDAPANDYVYTADDEDKLADYHMNCLSAGQNMTSKAREVLDLLNYLADF